MNRKTIAIMLCAAAVAYACAPRNRSAADKNPQHQPLNTAQSLDSASGLALMVTESADEGMAFALELRNNNDKLTEVRFANGRTHDFVVLDENNREVWRWSEGRLFTQSLQTKQLQKGEAVRYTARWDDAAPGRYRVVASLNSDKYAQSIEREFVVGSTEFVTR
jgi:hypothetical protein